MSNRLCFYCGIQLRNGRSAEYQQKTKDHKQPLSRGGKKSQGNIVWSCFACNLEKGKLTVEEYRAVMAYRRNVPREQYRFFGEGGPLAGKLAGVRRVRWEPKFILIA